VVETIDFSLVGTGYETQVGEVRDCLEDGRTESERMLLEDTLTVMRWLDRARRAIALRRPGE
jgi:hypothetical protein